MGRILAMMMIGGIGLLPYHLLGQLVTKNFKFEDGIYLSLESFQRNQPDYKWDEVEASLVTNPQSFTTKVEYLLLNQEEKQQTIDVNNVWGLCLGGIPYIQLKEQLLLDSVATHSFAGLRVRGRICYFTFQEEATRLVKISAYNPLNGKPFRTAEIPKKEIYDREQIMDFESGVVVDFNVPNFLNWIESDEDLWQTVNELNAKEADDKLFKCLLIFVDRNPIYIKS